MFHAIKAQAMTQHINWYQQDKGYVMWALS